MLDHNYILKRENKKKIIIIIQKNFNVDIRLLRPPGYTKTEAPMERECVITTNQAKDRADAQRLVTTRLLDRLHDPLGRFSRLQRIYPRVWWHCNSPASCQRCSLQKPFPACWGTWLKKAYLYPTTTCGATSPRSGTDSDLEAFSHNLADGSVAALPGQTAAKTNYLNQRFLSY